jgi:hypothetical protein
MRAVLFKESMMAQGSADIRRLAKWIAAGGILFFLAVVTGCCFLQFASGLAFEPSLPPDALEATNAANVALYNQTQTAVALALPRDGPSVDPKADVLKAFSLQNKTFPQRITETSSNSSSQDSLVRVMELAGPGEQHVTWTSPSFNGEMIQTGGSFYLLFNGQWSQSDTAPLDMPTEVNLPDILSHGLTTAAYHGLDPSAGIEAFAYSFNIELQGIPGKGMVWIGTSSGLPYKATYESVSGDYTFTAELTYEYDLEVTITAPIP